MTAYCLIVTPIVDLCLKINRKIINYVAFKSNDVIALYSNVSQKQKAFAMLPTSVRNCKQRLQQVFTGTDLTLWLVYASRQHLPKITQEFIALSSKT